MRCLRLLATSVAVIPIVGTSVSRLDGQELRPPVATVKPKIDTLHGEVRTDNYFWIREKSNPEVVAYLNAENAYTATKMKHTEALQQKLYDEMLSRTHGCSSQPP
jgi:oligopeptidase B